MLLAPPPSPSIHTHTKRIYKNRENRIFTAAISLAYYCSDRCEIVGPKFL